jgi:hypothetical protein
MNTITSDKFASLVEKDPAWASRLTEPLGITGPVSLRRNRITHLSPFLHFEGGKLGSQYKEVTCFYRCEELKVAEGHFSGWADFEECGIERIGAMTFEKTSDLFCDLTGTPLAEKNPREAVAIMTGSQEIEAWIKTRKIVKEIGWVQTIALFDLAIQLEKRRKAIADLRKPEKGTLEI